MFKQTKEEEKQKLLIRADHVLNLIGIIELSHVPSGTKRTKCLVIRYDLDVAIKRLIILLCFCAANAL